MHIDAVVLIPLFCPDDDLSFTVVDAVTIASSPRAGVKLHMSVFNKYLVVYTTSAASVGILELEVWKHDKASGNRDSNMSIKQRIQQIDVSY